MDPQQEHFQLDIAGIFSHEIMTPLMPILYYSNSLRHAENEKLPSPEMLREIHGTIHASALRLQHTLENVVLYAELEELRHTPERKRVSEWTKSMLFVPHEHLSAWAMLKARTMRRHHDLRITLPAARICCSAFSMRRILDEVLDNAFKFSEPGTLVRIESRAQAETWELSISDQGRGMTTEQIAKINAFVQFNREQYEQQGMGLGLRLTQLLTQLQHGECAISSIPGRGTTVTLTFRSSRDG